MQRNRSTKSANDFFTGFTGTEQLYNYNFGLYLTDGTKHVAEETQSFWFLDVVCSYKFDEKQRMKGVYCQKWKLIRQGDTDKFEVQGFNDNNDVVITQTIPFSNFPFDEYEVLVMDNIILLPSEN